MSDRTGTVTLTGLRSTDLSVDEVLAAVTAPEVGGTAVFVGTVRDNDADPGGARRVDGLDYSAHPDAERVLARVASEVAATTTGGVTVAVLHRTGSLAVGEVAIVAAAGATHRGVAFAACHRLVDEVKARVPIWKRERYLDGTTWWVGMPAAVAASDSSGEDR